MRGPAFNGTMIGVIDYGAGNLRSVQRSLEHLGLKCTITRAKLEASMAMAFSKELSACSSEISFFS